MTKSAFISLITVFTVVFVIVFVAIVSLLSKNSSNDVPHFKVGDCIADPHDVERSKVPKEKWETDYDRTIKIRKILEVGNKKYRTVTDYYGVGRMEEGSYDIAWDNISTLVACSKRLAEYNEATSN